MSPVSINRHTRLRKANNVLFRVVNDEAIVVLLNSNQVLVLNEVAARVLELVEHGASVEQVTTTILSEFEVDEDQLEQDLRNHLTELLEAGIVEVDPAGAVTEQSDP